MRSCWSVAPVIYVPISSGAARLGASCTLCSRAAVFGAWPVGLVLPAGGNMRGSPARAEELLSPALSHLDMAGTDGAVLERLAVNIDRKQLESHR